MSRAMLCHESRSSALAALREGRAFAIRLESVWISSEGGMGPVCAETGSTSIAAGPQASIQVSRELARSALAGSAESLETIREALAGA